MSLAIGFDLGGTTVTAALVSETGEILTRLEAPTPAEQAAEKTLELMNRLFHSLFEQAPGSVAGIGMGLAGLVDPFAGIVHTSPNLPLWKDVNLREPLEREFQVPVYLDNDVKAMALGELHFGAGQGADSMLCLTVGTGIGSAIVLQGKVYRGATLSAGEFGHVTVVQQGGKLCGCGNTGCLETVAGTQGILSLAQRYLERGQAPILAERVLAGEKLMPRLVAEAAAAGDAGAQKVWQEVGDWLGTALAGVVNFLNPEKIVIGGGIAQAGSLLFDPVQSAIQTRAFALPAQKVQVLSAQLGPDAGIIGASVLARTGVQA
ncbi:glucokinase [bacterium (Candidatus Blackallbacteria) CG17_big_fil_post_rev_8_21_14_2_50_48_46]|uniref:Glucokinase n=1 Tax=bacterium (Candidatus Blackallbacteria) CG17_big_fil_post_rev_8_21_14_2_50_48_46 TaxID=2014261 RepID=A0A2M7FYC6_9BACT|nr:MAG: glucokinase [bacterium (Candidatus Blackallbacteria) CG18_big_fil_WC_8_21_14_2_50_49_26]PIW14338.1 MAG: glucokinase [bacterium (Candidatus Blackallbacteria) CG17_big_fil_post_rev_8_21_14_2_50_48_46]PIW45607.1 MAG: glucokinase [bacterium (Candidatus Blackallbacteria) CG13_big_fil_rev_8_21_14_2_50_49_14]